MSVQPGWYDEPSAGGQRWWDGARWTEHVRPAAAAAPAPAGIPMGWYQPPGTADVRWWDGAAWTPYRIRDGRPRPDAMAIEPIGVAIGMGSMFIFLAMMQIVLFTVSRTGGALVSPMFFLIAGAVFLIGGVWTARVRKLPAPQTAAVVDPVARPMPGDAEAAGAGWYPMNRQTSRWWTGTRWSWYTTTQVGVRPGHYGPTGYRVMMVIGWVIGGLGAVALLAGIVLGVTGGIGGGMVEVMLAGICAVVGVVFILLGAFVLLLTRYRRFALILPDGPPPIL